MNATIRTTTDDATPATMTAGGIEERGPARTRHFVREAEQVDGVNISGACDTGAVYISVRELAAFGPLQEIAADHDYLIAIDEYSDGVLPSTGAAAVRARPREQ